MVRDHSVILIRYKEDRLFESIVCAIPIKQGERIRALHDDRRGNLWIGLLTIYSGIAWRKAD